MCGTGNKGLGFRGAHRLVDFARWCSERPEKTIVVAGHSLWFRSFFQAFLPPGVEHTCKKRKIVNCGVVGFTLQAGRGLYHYSSLRPLTSLAALGLQVGRDADGLDLQRIDPESISVVYGGFASK